MGREEGGGEVTLESSFAEERVFVKGASREWADSPGARVMLGVDSRLEGDKMGSDEGVVELE